MRKPSPRRGVVVVRSDDRAQTKSVDSAAPSRPAALFAVESLPLSTAQPVDLAPREAADDSQTRKPRAGKSANVPAPAHSERDQIILEHLPLVKAIAVRVHENLPVHVDLDDLVHAGVLGLFDAVSKFDSEKQVAFSSYAKHRIKGAILDSLRQLDWASRDLRRRHKQVEAATRELSSELHRQPTEAEIAAKLGVDQERWRQMMLDLRNVGLVSASTRAQESEDLPAPDFPSKVDTHPDFICIRQELRGALGEAIKVLPERYQKVVFLYYTNEMTMKEIGGVLGINESRVSQIHKSALEKMQVVLTSNGISSSGAFAE
jgi:RNA polymerase sigma factor for flagellar operon FliA